MHPVNYLFEDIYRNDWGLALIAGTEKRRGTTSAWKRDLRILVERKRG
ncbi:hypothetical protein [Mesorhizobium amorphae]|jgi:hypothetical protein|nr:hypothetical protein [Mesorhizobium amorphae]